jgi:hypothetical protein
MLDRLYLLYFLTGWVTEFSETTESVWFVRFPVTTNQLIGGAVNLAWGLGRPLLAWSSDYFMHRSPTMKTTRMKQCALALLLPAILWVVIAIENTRSASVIVVVGLILLAEFGPATVHTVLDAMKATHYNETGENISLWCDGFRLVGAAMAKVAGNTLYSRTNATTVFTVHSVCFFAFSALCFSLDRRAYKRVRSTEVAVKEEEEEVVVKEGPDRSFVAFMCVVLAQPVGGTCLFYFMYGPLHMSVDQMGWIDALCSTMEFLTSFCAVVAPRNLQKTSWAYAVWISLIQVALMAFIGRLNVGYVSNFTYYLLLSMMDTIVRSVFSSYFTRTVTEKTTEGNEAFDYAQQTSVAQMVARGLRLSMEYGLAKHYRVDHHEFDGYFFMSMTIALMSTAAVWSSLLVRRTK